jgi:hypothetical protein
MAGFRYVRSISGGNDVVNNKHQLAASLTVQKGDCLNFSAGKLAVAGTTELVKAIAQEDVTSTSTSLSKINVIAVTDDQIYECTIAPTIEELATGGSTTTVTASEATSDNDYDAGTIYVAELNEQRVIDDSQDTAGVVTFTVIEPFSRAIVAGDHIKVIPFAAGASPALNSAGDCVDVTVANKTGGKLEVEAVDLRNEKVQVRFLQA